jgi:hypothetical protein
MVTLVYARDMSMKRTAKRVSAGASKVFKPVRKTKRNQNRNYSIRITQDVLDRLDRITEKISPRLKKLLGREGVRVDSFRMALDRGMDQIEKEFGLEESPERYVLVDDLEDEDDE